MSNNKWKCVYISWREFNVIDHEQQQMKMRIEYRLLHCINAIWLSNCFNSKNYILFNKQQFLKTFNELLKRTKSSIKAFFKVNIICVLLTINYRPNSKMAADLIFFCMDINWPLWPRFRVKLFWISCTITRS